MGTVKNMKNMGQKNENERNIEIKLLISKRSLTDETGKCKQLFTV